MLVDNQNWNAIVIFKEFLISLWKNKPLKGENEYQTIVNAVELDAKKEALEEFINNIEKIAHDIK